MDAAPARGEVRAREGERSAPHRTVQMFGLQWPPTSPRKPLTRLATAQRSEAPTSGPGDVSSTQTCGGEGGEAVPLLERRCRSAATSRKGSFLLLPTSQAGTCSWFQTEESQPSEHVGDRPQLASPHGNTVHFQSPTEDKLHLLHVCAPHPDTSEKIARNGSLKPLKPL